MSPEDTENSRIATPEELTFLLKNDVLLNAALDLLSQNTDSLEIKTSLMKLQRDAGLQNAAGIEEALAGPLPTPQTQELINNFEEVTIGRMQKILKLSANEIVNSNSSGHIAKYISEQVSELAKAVDFEKCRSFL